MTPLLRKGARIALGLVLMAAPGAYFLAQSMPARHPPHPASQSVVDAAATTDVLTTTVALGRGDAVTADHLGHLKIVGPPPPGALTDPRSAEFHVAVTAVPAGQILMASALSAAPAAAGLAVLVPPGKRAIALHVSNEIAVGNFLRPGDHADLIAVFDPPGTAGRTGSEARVVLQDVEVLTVGGRVASDRTAAVDHGGGMRHRSLPLTEVTLAVSPEQAAQIALVRSVARYYLALRNYRDNTRLGEVHARFADLVGPPAGPAAPPRTSGHAIEALIGPKLEHVEVRP